MGDEAGVAAAALGAIAAAAGKTATEMSTAEAVGTAKNLVNKTPSRALPKALETTVFQVAGMQVSDFW